MSLKKILLTMAETLPEDATIYDAINQLEYTAAILPSVRRNHTLRAWASRYARLVLERCGGNKREACRVLGISYHTLQAHVRGTPLDDEGTPVPSAEEAVQVSVQV